MKKAKKSWGRATLMAVMLSSSAVSADNDTYIVVAPELTPAHAQELIEGVNFYHDLHAAKDVVELTVEIFFGIPVEYQLAGQKAEGCYVLVGSTIRGGTDSGQFTLVSAPVATPARRNDLGGLMEIERQSCAPGGTFELPEIVRKLMVRKSS